MSLTLALATGTALPPCLSINVRRTTGVQYKCPLKKFSFSNPAFCVCSISLNSNHSRALCIAIYWHASPEQRPPMDDGLPAYKETRSRSTSSTLMTTIDKLHYDGAGNAYSRDQTGAWQPHPGIAQTVARPSHVSQPDPFAHTGLNGTVSLTPRTNRTCPQGYRTQPTPPATYPLDTPAQFSTQRRHPSPSPFAGGSQRTWRESDHDIIDPALRPLPHSADLDLTDPVTIAKANGYTAASKTAGARRKAHTTKGKGKENSQPTKRAREITADDDGDIRVKRGRPSGSNNYTTADINALLDFVEREKPLGQRGWQKIHVKFSEWATEQGRPDRKVSSLETKFKQLVKTTKPTGDGVCPPEVTRAHQIDTLINERAGTRDLNDAEFDDDHDDDDTHSNSSGPDEPQHVAVTKATRTEAPVPRRNARGAAAAELLTRLSGAFDPATQRARDEERADRSLANTQLLAQAQQLRDAQARIDTLHAQVFDLRSKLYDSQRACDMADLRVEMLRSQTSGSGGRHHKKIRSPPPKRKSMMHEYYPDGGQSIRWLTDEEFAPYEDSSAEEGQHIGGPACNAREARRRLSHRLAMGKAKDTIVVGEPASAMRSKDGTPDSVEI